MRVANRLLEVLTRRARDGFLRDCEPVSLVRGAVVCERNMPYRHVYFPMGACVSLAARVGDHPPLEIALIGNEGMLGATLALGAGTAGLHGVVRDPGTAWRISAPRFRRALRERPALHAVVRRYLFVVLMQLPGSAACAHFHDIGARLARCLLMTHDRAHANRFQLTHEQLADLLGVRRSAVTIAAGALRAMKVIRYARGSVEVVDRGGLEAAACECYRAAIGDYARMFD